MTAMSVTGFGSTPWHKAPAASSSPHLRWTSARPKKSSGCLLQADDTLPAHVTNNRTLTYRHDTEVVVHIDR